MTYEEWKVAHPIKAEALRMFHFVVLVAIVGMVAWGFARDDGADASRTHVPGHTNLGNLEDGVTPIWVTVDGHRVRCLVLYNSYHNWGSLSCDWSKR